MTSVVFCTGSVCLSLQFCAQTGDQHQSVPHLQIDSILLFFPHTNLENPAYLFMLLPLFLIPPSCFNSPTLSNNVNFICFTYRCVTFGLLPLQTNSSSFSYWADLFVFLLTSYVFFVGETFFIRSLGLLLSHAPSELPLSLHFENNLEFASKLNLTFKSPPLSLQHLHHHKSGWHPSWLLTAVPLCCLLYIANMELKTN